jgi:hypothetical protein
MKEHQFDDFNKVIDYNSELWFRFLSSCEEGMSSSDKTEQAVGELSQSLDLVRAINSYRAYPTIEGLFNAYPELEAQSQYVELLWKHFSSLSSEELSELAMEMIHEVCSCSEALS